MEDKDIKILESYFRDLENGWNNCSEDYFETYCINIETIKAVKNLLQAYKQYEEKLMYALNPTNSELAIKTKEDFKKIIRENINEDTYTIRKELKKYWNDMDNYFKDKKDEYKQFDIEEFINYKINKGMQEGGETFPID